MNLSKLVMVAGLACVLGSAAMADEVDFYSFRTRYSPDANSKAKFYAKVLQTSTSDSTVNDSNEHKCFVSPATPANFSCKVSGEWLWLDASQKSALTILTKGYGVSETEVVEAQQKELGVFQFLLSRDRVFHVVMKAPSVVDDSMECEVAVVTDKNKAMIRCRSEFYHDKNFEVRDVPVAQIEDGFFCFGAAPRGRYDDEASWREKNAAASAKAREVLAGIAALKKKTIANLDAAYNVGIGLDQSEGAMVKFNLYVSSTYYRTYYGATSVDGIDLRGKVQYVHRGLKPGRRGD